MSAPEPTPPTVAPPSCPGLSSAEAGRRLAALGDNLLVPRRRGARLREALSLLADPMALMLLGTAVLYLALGEVRDGVILLVALVPVLGIDVILEARSHGALAQLARQVAPRARVIRDGAETEVETATLVPGDVLLLREGDIVHADGAVSSAANLSIDESQLTGESAPQPKSPDLPGDGGRFFAGSLVLGGHGVGLVEGTGPRTRYGQIARLVEDSGGGPTPLQRKTGAMVRVLFGVAVVLALGVFALRLSATGSLREALLAGVSLAMAAVPEEFPLVFTLFLSLGAYRLSRHGVLVRRLACVETLGSTTVICSDKTGTLTEGRFSLEAPVPCPAPADAAPLGADGAADGAAADGAAAMAGLLRAAVLACETHPADTMERAIVDRARAAGVGTEADLAGYVLLRDHDFDPLGKHMSHVFAVQAGATGGVAGAAGGVTGAAGGVAAAAVGAAGAGRGGYVAAKGALEGILEHCADDPAARRFAEAENRRLADQGMRVLAVAGRRVPAAELLGADRAADERGLHLLGLLGLRDPLRAAAPEAVAACQAAGIEVKLVTGDHALTAHAIAEAAGIRHNHDGGLLTGDELDALPPPARSAALRRASILSRIRPEQKHALVVALQEGGAVVAMTGDGINDAPALRRADIGVSMGQRGTAVARAASGLVLLHDDLASLVATVREGRHILYKIQRAFLFLIAFHVPIVALALLAPLLGLPLLLMPVHLIWLELIVHPVSALVFEGEPAPADLMRRPPRSPEASLLPARGVLLALLSGSVLSAAALWVFAAGARGAGPDAVLAARGMALSVVVLGSVVLTWVELAPGRRFGVLQPPRTLRFYVIAGLVLLSLPVFLYVPAFARVLQAAPPPLSQWPVCVGLALCCGLVRLPLRADG